MESGGHWNGRKRKTDHTQNLRTHLVAMATNTAIQGLPLEIVEEVLKQVDLTTLGNVCQTCSTYTRLSDALWTSHCLRLYSAEFWTRAQLRPPQFSLPLEGPMHELKRLVQWKALIYPEVWPESNFFVFWESQSDPVNIEDT